MDEYINALLEKSEEAYLMALEIINKPTIKYRTEGFVFFICNAWELLLKAQIIKTTGDITSIEFKDKSGRTLGLDKCIEKVFTSTTDKTKDNLNFVRGIRNRATHLIVSDFDYSFSGAFQRCVTNYVRFFSKQFPDYNLNSTVQPFVSLVKPLTHTDDRLIIGPAKDYFEKLKNEYQSMPDETVQTFKLVATKKQNEADLKYALDKNADEKAQKILVPTDPQELYPYRTKKAVNIIQQTLDMQIGVDHKFTQASFERICKEHAIKTNPDYCYLNPTSDTNKTPQYNDAAIEHISAIFINDPKKYTRKS